ncbi:dynein heavy chain 5, axonemal-like [Octopus vulgaris]|uniref:Dynein heavy chain 5, axonemal-like n=1 Tax=Octopus vulgaris TaxID=6645 RepID=A0AA36F961_OCTVU|nr:dynein heavy chain 5, axonemal-like [Octopus vulgaris]
MGIKKNTLLSGEALKEMQKLVKATREDRRMMVSDALKIEVNVVEEFVLSDEKFDAIEEFFDANGRKKLIFFYQTYMRRDSLYNKNETGSQHQQPCKKLSILTGSTEHVNGICCYFLRTSNKAVTDSNISQNVSFGVLDCRKEKILPGIGEHLNKIILDSLKSLESWGSLSNGNGPETKVGEFLEQIERFSGSVNSSINVLEGQLALVENGYGQLISGLECPQDYQAAAGNSESVDKFEELLGIWANQIEQVLAESEQMRREADDIGPTAELIHWKNRMSKFNNLLEQIKSKKVKTVVGVLQAAKSKSLKRWKELDGRITDAANEAKDNVKYLYTLEKFFGSLIKCNPVTIVEHIPSLINAVRMIYCISQYYNTSERMTSLFVKITNQMIATCKVYLLGDVSRIWDHKREVLIPMLRNCIHLNEKYQEHFQKTKQRLQANPAEKQFEFSENYIFGKFDAFCKRLERINEMVNIMTAFSVLQDIKIEGIDTIVVKYKTIVESVKKKNYDILDHRKTEFDQDYADFLSQTDSIRVAIQHFVHGWMERSLPTAKAIELILKFELVKDSKLDLSDHYHTLLRHYNKDLETVRRLYQKQKMDPAIARNMPPLTGRIHWVRHLYRQIEEPMKLFRNKPDILKHPDAQSIIVSYNKMASVLLEFELLYYQSWCKAVDSIKNGLHVSLLVRHPETQEMHVNFDYHIIELIEEAKCLNSMLAKYKHIQTTIPQVLWTLTKPLRDHVEKVLKPGLGQLTWTSFNINSYVVKCNQAIDELKKIVKRMTDLLECQIDAVLDDISLMPLCELPEDEPITVHEFLEKTSKVVSTAAEAINISSQLVEKSVEDLANLLISNLKEEERQGLTITNGFPCMSPDNKHKNQRTRLTLDFLKRRLQNANKYKEPYKTDTKSPLFLSKIVLQIPNVVLSPSLDEIQQSLNKAVQMIVKISQNIAPWKHFVLQQKQQMKEMEQLASEQSEEQGKAAPPSSTIKPFHRLISDHKDVVKVVIQLGSAISTYKTEVQNMLTNFSKYSELWTQDPSESVNEFVTQNPILTDYEEKIKYLQRMEQEVEELDSTYQVGSIVFEVDTLKLALLAENKAWQQGYARALNEKSSEEMNEILTFFDNTMKRLCRPLKDLDDVRAHMAALNEIREAEVRIDMTIAPIEETYAMLNKYNLVFNDGNAERVDSLTYGYFKLKTQSQEVQAKLLEIQPQFKSDLLTGCEVFSKSVTQFVAEYDSKGPMEPGIKPSEASDRLTICQSQFDELWSKFLTYSGGEELFGLTVTQYPDLHRIKRELTLLQRLYQLYNSVLDSVSGYYDILWADIDIDKINNELLEFQNRCRKLPKALKEWQAYEDLRKTIDDFNETCPLLEMMSNRAMQQRHWQRLSTLTGHDFDVNSDNFLLRNLMEAPLLVNKEEIEDICISAVKEKDIEAKLKQVILDWDSHDFQFSTFKSRGELLLKGDTTSETVALMEDSLMILGSLLSNRYNAPFKSTIQTWVQNLTSTTEIIENWLVVQNLWIYLEAVFVGGDIAKQLPQEAKRFSNIDKSWMRIMQRAHEISKVVTCCVGDDILSRLLPHLLEQLEMCQKSLTGYLEKKRLVFPRFFFVSDPALLEILGQASDSHTIQAHLLSVFDNTKSVQFDEKYYDRILSIHSQEGECIALEETVHAQGNVEVWLGDLLRISRRSLHGVIRTAAMAITDPTFKLLEFENMFPAQVGLLGLQMIWTQNSELALTKARSDKKIMANTNVKFTEILNELIDITTKELTKIERTKFETLITIHVHQKDIFEDLVRMHIRSVNDFEWLKQSRFYFKEDTDQCLISITDVNFKYMNEFLGCTDRLVITPLTDRCYITLSQALGMALGGAPAGPAGTGKTETTKDMGRCLGKYVVVFNCSDQMDYRGLGRIYKGLAQSGSWGCFDEFNRIELPVLSVAAQQIAIILTCKKERKPQFIFTDGDTVDMDPEFGLFLTMNPGYAGRQELPENLKINFRTVAMMVPDRGIIMRVKLASCGFQQNVMLAKKFYTLYKLCEEQLTKQVDEDEPLFMSLIDDLFPGMTLDKAGYPSIEAAIATQVTEAGLIAHSAWVLKLIQLYETQKVRHGMMTLGPSGAGKTKCIYVLQKALTVCGMFHKEMRMNPKAITAPQMFGRLDVATNDWTDGIFSTLWRKTLKMKKGEHVWIVLDGPVDAIWIENLNSVLDDNKTLTLANGDRIPMAPNCKIIFEVHNIDNASPATVSRNGMVFMSSSVLTWEPILRGWLLTRPPSQSEHIFNAFENAFSIIYSYLVQNLSPKMKLLECNYIRQAIDLLEGLIPSEEDRKDITHTHLDNLIVFAMMWSLGALLEISDRQKLEEFIKTNCSLSLPDVDDDNTIFEYLVSEQGTWQHWSEKVSSYIYPTDSTPEYTAILVPNVDNVRTDFLIGSISKQGKAVLLTGEQGTAKTVMIQGYCSKYNPEQYLFKSFSFSSATTPFMFQRTIESYVDKRMGTTYGPPAGKKLSIFVDDINMPVINEWGDQVTNEITRQLMETNGFFNLEKPGEFTTIVDIQMLAAMIHPGGGRNDIPERLKRHFCIFNCTLPSNASIDKIFTTLGCGHFCKERQFPDSVIDFVKILVPATRKLWQKVKLKMLPTPAKFHYVFNLRDLSRIWQYSVLESDTITGTAEAEVIKEPQVLISLWTHECTRVLADRFTEIQDKTWFEGIFQQVVEEECGLALAQDMVKEPYFVDFLQDAPEATGEEEADVEMEAPKVYEPISSYEQLAARLNTFMDQYNEAIRGSVMDLVFFKDAMTHLVKISRIIRTTKGHALLVGVGGSGKQSLTRLASFIAGFKTFQITLSRSYNVSNLMEDLKFLYRMAGQEGKSVTFLFTDNEIKDESFLEYLNNILASGEVSNLFAREEIDEILQELVIQMKKEFPRRPPTNENLYDYYLSRIRQNLHVVLCFSPVGEKFRSRSLKFPGLISGCTMDWFQRWPKDALVAVSHHFLSNFDIACSPEVKTAVVNTMGTYQDVVAEMSVDYFQRYRRQTHVTPKSYLSFISGYKQIYFEKRTEIGSLDERMKTGLQKLLEATESVNELSKQLAVKEKELEVASKKSDEVLAEVTTKAQAAENVKAQVQQVKDKAQAIVDAISVDKAIAEEKLEAAKPALEQAESALQTIKPTHIATVRKLSKPPHLIMRIMDCVLLLFQRRVEPITMDPERSCPKPSWIEAQKLMSSGQFLQGLLTFPKDTINSETVEFLHTYLTMEDYNLETAKKVCGDVAGLLSWTCAMATFFGINKEVLPLKANLASQAGRLEVANSDLAQAQAQLDDKQQELDKVQAMYDAAMREKQILREDAEACRRKMSNATTLIEGLAGERLRWTEASKSFQEQIKKLVGDVLLATGFLSYSGPFNQEFRNRMIKIWKNEMSQANIPFSEDLNIVAMLAENSTITEWNLQGLPNDELSIQNGLIVNEAARYPLLIDPQGQGKSWIKNREKANELQVTTLNHKYFRTHLEDSLSLGRPLLIEDVGEELDPALDNVLERNFIKSGSTFKVKVGDKEVDITKGFRIYITTKLPNPAYTPEISARTSIIDFTVTIKGLEDQLLGIVILKEKQELEAERTKLLEEVSLNNRKMKELEDNLLFRLTSTEGSLVEDESLIQVLSVTKITAQEVSEKLVVAADTELKINTAREEFRPVATRGSILYFLVVEMSMVNVMYQTSLKQFLGLFDMSMDKSVKSPVTSKRIHNIIDYLTFEVFRYTCRGLYEKHKFLFTILMTLKIEIEGGSVQLKEFQVFIKGGAALDLNTVEPKPKKWISDMTWLNLVELKKLPQFNLILSQVNGNDKAWKSWFDEEIPEEAPIPDGYNNTLSSWHKLLLVRAWCPDRAIPMARIYVAEAMGSQVKISF